MEKKYEIKFYVGTEENKHNLPISRESREKYLSAAREFLAREFGAFTEYAHFGAWLHPAGSLVSEGGVTFVVISVDLETDKVRQSAEVLRHIFYQSAVLVTRAAIEGEFI